MKDHGRLEGKVAIVTGAASGIGKATAELFSKEGAKLMLADLSEEPLQEVVEQLNSSGGTVAMSPTNVAKENQIKSLIDQTLESYGQIDIISNNAGAPGRLCAIEDETEEDWINTYQVNVMGAVYAIKHVAAHMKERKQGSIVNTSSVAGMRAGAGPTSYSATKAALINYTQVAACELGGFNIRVNAVCPGLIRTAMTEIFFQWAEQKGKMDKMGSRCELRRYGHPHEVAAAILFLASDDASYITGQALPVDGGNTASLNLPGMKT
jgi:meso-butanediol dehydrogenase / (S,S)-butanediol dehydrogenase / diacetyl reductase